MAKAPTTTPKASADVQRIAVVPDPGAADSGVGAGAALTPGQLAGLDPLDPEQNAEEAENRDERTNRQTTHEAENALDPISGTPSPGITSDTPLTAKQQGSPPTDMNGRPPMDPDAVNQVRTNLSKAKKDDAADSKIPEDRRGWRTAQELGVSRTQMDQLIEDGKPIEMEEVPGGQFFPETGRRYRSK